MPATPYDLGWNLFVELRKEIVESQKIRTQIIGLKITLVSGAIGYFLSNLAKIDPIVLAIPAFAAIFFDLLISSYSFSIKRLGVYCHDHIERHLLRPSIALPEDLLLWQEFLRLPGTQQRFSTIGNVGLTALSLPPAIYGLFNPFDPFSSTTVLIMLLAAFAYDWRVFYTTSIKGRIDIGTKGCS